MVGTVSFTTLLICRVILGAGEGPAFCGRDACDLQMVPGREADLPTAILSQGSAFGVILAVPALNWVIVNYSWHYAFGALGVVGLMWVVAWLILGKEGPLVQTAAMAASEPRIPYFQLLTSRTFIGCCRRDLRRLLGAVARADLVHALHRQGARLLAAARPGLISILPWVFGAVIVMLTGWISQVMMARGFSTRGARGVLGSVPLIVGGSILAMLPHVERRGTADRAAGGRLRPVRIDLCGLPADARRVHAGVAARRGDRDLRRDLHARRHPRALGDGQRDPAARRRRSTAT